MDAPGRGHPDPRSNGQEDADVDGIWLARVLLAMTEVRETKAGDGEIVPIEPGAWAEWARDPEPSTPNASRSVPSHTYVAPGRFEVNPAVYPGRYRSRWSR
jgi:hypothetical protein